MAAQTKVPTLAKISAQIRWVNEPAVVLLCYLALAVFMKATDGSPLQVVLAVILILFGSGFSLVAVLFPRRVGLDMVERAALAAGLGLAISGILGFLLALSPWRLCQTSYMTSAVLFNFLCFVVVLYRRRTSNHNSAPLSFLRLDNVISGQSRPSLPDLLVSLGLMALLLSGTWFLTQTVPSIAVDPPMTEFYLLDDRGLLEDFPGVLTAGEALSVNFGVVNHEGSATQYQVRALVEGERMGTSPHFRLEPGESRITQIQVVVPEQTLGLVRLDFVLQRDDRDSLSTYLWFDVAPAKSLPSIGR